MPQNLKQNHYLGFPLGPVGVWIGVFFLRFWFWSIPAVGSAIAEKLLELGCEFLSGSLCLVRH